MILTPLQSNVYPTLPTTPTHTELAVNSGVSTTILSANSARKKATIQNYTQYSLYLKEGQAAVVGEGFLVSPGDIYLVQTTAAVNGIQGSGSAQTYKVFEAT